MNCCVPFFCRPPPEPPASEETLGMPVLGAAGGVPLDDNEEEGDGKMKDIDLGKEVDEDEDSWQDSSSCSPLPGDPVPLALVKTKVNQRKIFLLTYNLSGSL